MTITIFFWLLTLILFASTAVFLTIYIFYQPGFRGNLRILIDGIKNGLSTSGFQIPQEQQKVILYKWIPTETACDEAFDRADSPAKDIIDWMEEGLPRTPEMERKCTKNCQCRLMAVRRPSHKNPHPPV